MARSIRRAAEANTLAPYGRKRDFARTPEPAARIAHESGDARRFVVHLHDARRRHFDLRLEMGGVLKCWAVTRGPSANPAARRLAVRTEDHPVAYLEFEGLIPKGAYGAGPSLIWDRGNWLGASEADAMRSLAEGHLKLRLAGERMKGGWSLVRISSQGERENWLLIKERDRHAETDDSLSERHVASVTSGLTLGDIAAGRKRPATRRKGRAKSPPAFVPPMLCKLDTRVPQGDDWLYEMKYDGYRMQLSRSGSVVAIRTRNGNDWTTRFPAIAESALSLGEQTLVLDGEIVVFDKQGISSFAALKDALSHGDDEAMVLVAFDVLRGGARDLRTSPLRERKRRLEKILAGAGPDGAIRIAPYVVGEGDALMRDVENAGGEGIVAKRSGSVYRSERSDAWRKIKVSATAVVLVVGYTASQKGMPFASLLVAEPDDAALRYVGRIGTGFPEAVAKALHARMQPLRRASPSARLSGGAKAPRRGVVWLKPEVAVTVRFNSRTRDGMLRGARLVALRDRSPSRVGGARTVVAPSARPQGRDNTVLTNPTRVIFPDIAVTKRDVADHYQRVAERLLPHLDDRPVSVLRAPDGIGAETFFQRHPMPAMRRGIRHMPDPEGKHRDYMIVDGKEGLQTIVQFGGIELHGWGARASAIGCPDRLVFDLDPAPDVAFLEVRRAARLLKDVLASAALTSFPMLTGGKGIHVVVPLDGTQSWDQVEAFASGLARKLASLEPSRFVATMSKRRREGRIFIDWLRNKSSATAIMPYSLRARPGAPVAIPIDWSNLEKAESASQHSIGCEALLRQRPWRRYFAVEQRLTSAARSIVVGK